MKIQTSAILLLCVVLTDAFGTNPSQKASFVQKLTSRAFKAMAVPVLVVSLAGGPVLADDLGASSGANAKITTGGASTLQSGRTIGMSRTILLLLTTCKSFLHRT